jgi:DNA-binding LacI/PurR family transcriptional regulator
VFSGFENGQQAAQAFLERGHRRIAYLYDLRYSMVNEREAGLRAAISAHPHTALCQLQLEEFGLPAIPDGSESRRAIGAALKKLLFKPDRPTAIFCNSLTEAEQVYLHAVELGFEVPADLSLICFGSTWRESALAQRISCVCVDEPGIGRRAAQLLHEMRAGNRALDSNEQIVFPSSLFVGETLGGV